MGGNTMEMSSASRSKEGEREAAEELRLLSALLDGLPVPVFHKDGNGIYRGCNAAFEALLGLSRAEIVGRSVRDITPRELAAIHEDADRQLLDRGGTTSYDGLIRDSNGASRDALIYKAAFDTGEAGSRGVVGVVLDITERKWIASEIERLAYQDPLTRLPNRTLLKDRLQQALAQARREVRNVGILVLDLDRFKRVNDTLGIAAGDHLLRKVGERLQRAVRQSDTVARLGSDEFVIACPGLHSPSAMDGIARKVLTLLSDPFEVEGQEVYVSASIGISVAPLDGEVADTLLNNAEMAMYSAKEEGSHGYRFYSESMNHRSAARLTMETSLRKALQQNELFLVYHPQLDLREGRLTGMEALLRWRHPLHGVVPPGDFIPLAEETGLILAIGEWVLRTACRQNSAWQRAGYPPLRVAVNVSGRQLKQPDFVSLVCRVLEETGHDPQLLELELTESIFMDNVEETAATLNSLKALGIQLAIDDFGTGFSSLGYLKHFPIDRIKIAQSFVCDVTTGTDNAAIIDAIIAMARSLNLRLVAEGVETREQLHFLRERQCHEMQGFYFSEPLGEDEFTRYLAREGDAGGTHPYGQTG